VRSLLFIWTEVIRPITSLIGTAVHAYPWLLAIPVAMAVFAALAFRQELDQ
jgi:hypothetical protein